MMMMLNNNMALGLVFLGLSIYRFNLLIEGYGLADVMGTPGVDGRQVGSKGGRWFEKRDYRHPLIKLLNVSASSH